MPQVEQPVWKMTRSGGDWGKGDWGKGDWGKGDWGKGGKGTGSDDDSGGFQWACMKRKGDGGKGKHGGDFAWGDSGGGCKPEPVEQPSEGSGEMNTPVDGGK